MLRVGGPAPDPLPFVDARTRDVGLTMSLLGLDNPDRLEARTGGMAGVGATFVVASIASSSSSSDAHDVPAGTANWLKDELPSAAAAEDEEDDVLAAFFAFFLDVARPRDITVKPSSADDLLAVPPL